MTRPCGCGWGTIPAGDDRCDACRYVEELGYRRHELPDGTIYHQHPHCSCGEGQLGSTSFCAFCQGTQPE